MQPISQNEIRPSFKHMPALRVRTTTAVDDHQVVVIAEHRGADPHCWVRVAQPTDVGTLYIAKYAEEAGGAIDILPMSIMSNLDTRAAERHDPVFLGPDGRPVLAGPYDRVIGRVTAKGEGGKGREVGRTWVFSPEHAAPVAAVAAVAAVAPVAAVAAVAAVAPVLVFMEVEVGPHASEVSVPAPSAGGAFFAQLPYAQMLADGARGQRVGVQRMRGGEGTILLGDIAVSSHNAGSCATFKKVAALVHHTLPGDELLVQGTFGVHCRVFFLFAIQSAPPAEE